MPTTPTGYLSLALSQFRLTVAASATFRAWTGTTGNDTNALARVHVTKAATVSATQPLAIVEGPAEKWRKETGAASERWLGEAEILLTFRAAISDSDDVDAAYTFRNAVGAIVLEMQALAGRVGYSTFDRIEQVPPGPVRPENVERVTIADFYEAQYRAFVGLVNQ